MFSIILQYARSRHVYTVIQIPIHLIVHASCLSRVTQTFSVCRNSGISTSGRIFTRSCRRRKCCQPCCSLCCTLSKAARRRNTNGLCFPRLSTYYIQNERRGNERETARNRHVSHLNLSSVSLSLSLSFLRSRRPLFANRKSIQGTVTLLENLHIILEKTPQEYEHEVL